MKSRRGYCPDLRIIQEHIHVKYGISNVHTTNSPSDSTHLVADVIFFKSTREPIQWYSNTNSLNLNQMFI